MSDWQSTPYVERHKEFLEKLVATLIDCTFESVSRENPVLRWREPAYLQDIINFNLQEDPKSQENLLEIANNISKYSVKTGHPYFMNQLFSGWDVERCTSLLLLERLHEWQNLYTIIYVAWNIVFAEEILFHGQNLLSYK